MTIRLTGPLAKRRLAIAFAAALLAAGPAAAQAEYRAYTLPGGFSCDGATDGQVPAYRTVCKDNAGNQWEYKFPNDGVAPSTVTRTGPAGPCHVVNPATGPHVGTCGGPTLIT